MKILSWNVNGLRGLISKELFVTFVEAHKPDVLCLQETKTRDKVDVNLPGYHEYWNHAQKAGYAGTAIFTRVKAIKDTYGIGIPKHDEEGRVITLEFEKFFLVNVYVPNSKRDLSRLPYREKEWDADFLAYLKKLEKKKPVVFCGDLNVAHTELDLTYPKANVKNHGFTPEERKGFDQLVKAGFLDTFREFEKGGGHYTWWSKFNNCRGRNIGWRIDYFLISKSFRPHLKKAFILPDVLGSDHCPVGIELKP
jgi:exodeoxyribonuclease III